MRETRESERAREKKVCFFLLLEDALLVEGEKKISQNERTNDENDKEKQYDDAYMIRVGSMEICCNDGATVTAGREIVELSKEPEGVLNGDCFLNESGGVSS